jgi:ATP-dependent protease ClpP protease subunit
MTITTKPPLCGSSATTGTPVEGQPQKPYVVSFNTHVNPTTSQALLATVCQQLAQGYNDLHLLLSTVGGSVADGLTVYNVLRWLPVYVTTYNVGCVNSIGNVVFLAGDKRYAAKASSFMFHGVGFDIEKARFEEKELNARLASLQNDQALIADVIVRHTKLTKEQVRDLFMNAAFVPAAEACSRGIVDEVRDVELPKDVPIIQLVFGK